MVAFVRRVRQVEQYKRQGQELWSFATGGGVAAHLLAAGGDPEVRTRRYYHRTCALCGRVCLAGHVANALIPCAFFTLS